MGVKQITAWETSDGQVWADQAAAEAREQQISVEAAKPRLRTVLDPFVTDKTVLSGMVELLVNKWPEIKAAVEPPEAPAEDAAAPGQDAAQAPQA